MDARISSTKANEATGIPSQPAPNFCEVTASVVVRIRAITEAIFCTSRTVKKHFVLDRDIRLCHMDANLGRLLWTYSTSSSRNAPKPLPMDTCQHFIIEINCDAQFTQAQRTESMIRNRFGTEFLPNRLHSTQITFSECSLNPAKEWTVNATVYESAEGVRSLSKAWNLDLQSREYRSVVDHLMQIKRKLCTIAPTEYDLSIYEAPQMPIRVADGGPVLCPDYDFSRWNLRYSKGEEELDPAVLRDAKPTLALLNKHIPAGLRGEASVAADEKSITLHLGDGQQAFTFTAEEVKYLRNNMFLHHKMVNTGDIFVKGTGKNCRIVAILGWDTAGYCPAAYDMGVRDSMLGEEIKDSMWYLLLRREGLKRRKTKNALTHPAQIKLADMMHFLTTYRHLRTESLRKAEVIAQKEQWLLERKYEWKGGKVGWHTSWTGELKNILTDRVLGYANFVM